MGRKVGILGRMGFFLQSDLSEKCRCQATKNIYKFYEFGIGFNRTKFAKSIIISTTKRIT